MGVCEGGREWGKVRWQWSLEGAARDRVGRQARHPTPSRTPAAAAASSSAPYLPAGCPALKATANVCFPTSTNCLAWGAGVGRRGRAWAGAPKVAVGGQDCPHPLLSNRPLGAHPLSALTARQAGQTRGFFPKVEVPHLWGVFLQV